MSNKEIYAVKSSEGKYLNLFGNWIENLDYATFFAKKAQAKFYADRFNGQAIAIVEEPKKVVLTKEQAKVIKEAHDAAWPAKYITDHCDNSNGLEELLMNAYINGYTVAREKKYLVELDGLVTTDGAKQYLTKKNGKWFASRRMSGLHQDFTDEELNGAPEWAQQLNREEVTDDEQ